MMKWTIIFFIIALIAAVLGFTGIAGAGISIAQTLFFVFLVVAVITGILGALRG
ncbi:MAG: DUF1328 domain-containing protein [Myxococcales bacterium]|nr:DUF1328 domain-containing protein [Myxococcales bacterium]MCB9749401.1 DUF1328 domain-containing protein [Myxococcales bacterium]